MKTIRTLMIAAVVLVMGMMAVLPASAQQPVANDTITVTGTGSVSGAPTIATLQLGVEVWDADLSTAFVSANDRVNAVLQALVGAGVDLADISTAGLNIYQERNPMGEDPSTFQTRYQVSNLLSVRVRDITKVADVINAGIDAGANSLYGLSFDIADRAALENEARAKAMQDAQARANEISKLIGTKVGVVLSVVEISGGYMPMFDGGRGGGAAANAVITPGTLSVTLQLQVTYQIQR